MIPAHFSYAAWMMKSAESSAGLAPPTLVMQLGALSMIAGMALLPGVAPALGAHGPLHGCADHGEHDRDGDGEAHHFRSSSNVCGPCPFVVGTTAIVAVSTSVPSGSTTCSLITPIAGYTSVPYSTRSMPSSSTSGGTRSRFALLSTNE